MSAIDLAFGWLFVGPKEMKRSDDLDKQLHDINTAALERGRITDEQYALTEERIAEQNIDAILSDPETSVAHGFREGAEEGLTKLGQSVVSAAGAVARAIPWQGYALAGVALILFLAHSGYVPKRRK